MAGFAGVLVARVKDERYPPILQARAKGGAFTVAQTKVEHRCRQIWMAGQA
jgi:hypothetical protein